MKYLLLATTAVLVFANLPRADAASAPKVVTSDTETQKNVVTTQTTAATTSAVTSQVSNGVGAAVSPALSSGAGFASTAPTEGVAPNGTTSFSSRALSGEAAGEAAGGDAQRFGTWVQISNTWVKNTDAGGTYDGTSTAATVGFDYRISQGVILGMALGADELDVQTTYNDGTFAGNGYSVIPYIGFSFADRWIFTGLMSLTDVKYETTSNNGGTTGSFHAKRFSASGVVEGNYPVGDFTVYPHVGAFYMRESQDGFTDSSGTAIAAADVDLGRASGGATVGYNLGMVEPFVRAFAEYDFVNEDEVALTGGRFSSNDKFGINAGTGLKFTISDNLSGRFEADAGSLLRDNLDTYTVAGSLRFTW